METPVKASKELKKKYLQAEKLVNELVVIIPEEQKMTLYGLQKQVREGDCDKPQPPTSNTILTAKWEAWVACKGKSQARVMEEYVTIVDSLERKEHPAIELDPSSTITYDSNTVTGPLYKQRDLLGGWLIRYFKLRDGVLYYYLEVQDTVPRGMINILNCTVTAMPPIVADGKTLYPFTVALAQTGQQMNLATERKEDTDIWMKTLQHATSMNFVPSSSSSSSNQQSTTTTANTPATTAATSTTVAAATTETIIPPGYMTNIRHPTETRVLVPQEIQAKLEQAAKEVLHELTEDAPGWELFYEKSNYKVHKKRGTSIVHVKVESVLSYSLYEIMTLLAQCGTRGVEWDAKAAHDVVKVFSHHTWVEYIRFLPIWPASVRDMLAVAQWRYIDDDTVLLLFSSGQPYDHLVPLAEGNIRAELFPSAYLLKSTPNGTVMKYLGHSDLRGTLPSAIYTFANYAQADAIARLKTVLDGDKAKGLTRKPINHITNYEELSHTILEIMRVRDPETIARVEQTLLLSTVSSTSTSTSSSSSALSMSEKKHTATSTTSTSTTTTTTPNTSTSTTATTTAAEVAAAAFIGKSLTSPERAVLLQDASRVPRINLVAMMMVGLPYLTYLLNEGEWYCTYAVAVSAVITIQYLIRLQLGKSVSKTTSSLPYRVAAGGHMTFRFSADIEKLLHYVTKKRRLSGFDTMTITHLLIKAVAITLAEMPSMNGHVLGSCFYPHKNSSVDLSVLLDTPTTATTTATTTNNNDSVSSDSYSYSSSAVSVSAETVAGIVKIMHAESKSTEAITNELTSMMKDLKSCVQHEKTLQKKKTSSTASLTALWGEVKELLFPSVLLDLWGHAWYVLAAQYGITLSLSSNSSSNSSRSGHVTAAYPHGACTVITSPDAEQDVDISFAPHAAASMMLSTSAPILVTMGGTRIEPSLDAKKRVTGKATVNCTVMISTIAATTTEGKQFVERLRMILNDPNSLDSLHEQVQRKNEEAKYMILVQRAKDLLD